MFWKPANDFQEERKKFSETTVSLIINWLRSSENQMWFGFIGFLTDWDVFNLSSGLVSGGWGISGGLAVSACGLWGVDWGSLVGDISDESVDMVSGVSGGLDPAIGKSNHEATGNKTVGILCFCLLEVGLAVVISHSVLVGVWLGGKLLRSVGSGGSVCGRSSSESCGDESGGDEDLKMENFVKLWGSGRALPPTLNILCYVVPVKLTEPDTS